MILVNGEPATIVDGPATRDDTDDSFEVAGDATSELRLTELDQADPAGRFRFRVSGDQLLIQRAASADWATATTVLTISGSAGDTFVGNGFSAPSLAFTGDPDTSLYAPGANQFAITAGGSVRAHYNAGGVWDFSGGIALQVAKGNVGRPGFGFKGDPNTGMYRAGADVLGFTTGGSQRFRITSLGLEVNDGHGIFIGALNTPEPISSLDGATNVIPKLQVLGTAQTDGAIMAAVWSETATNAAAPLFALVKSGHAAIAYHTIVTDNEVLGVVAAFADDGVDLETNVAQIEFVVDDGTPAADAIGGEILLRTATTAGTMTTAMQIANDQGIFFPGLSTQAAGTAVSVTTNELHLDSSSRRYKNNEAPWLGSAEVLRALTPKTFTWEVEGWEGPDYGLIAEDGLTVFRPLVNLDQEGQAMSFRYPVLLTSLVGGWQEHEARFSTVEDRLRAVEDAEKILELEAEIARLRELVEA